MKTKYFRQIVSARKLITAKGTTVVWFKAGDPLDPNDPTPEFSEIGEGKPYPDTPCVFYPATATTQYTNVFQPLLGMAGENMICCIPGDVPFIPQQGDAVLLSLEPYDLRHVDLINKTAPDGTPILYEVSFR